MLYFDVKTASSLGNLCTTNSDLDSVKYFMTIIIASLVKSDGYRYY